MWDYFPHIVIMRGIFSHVKRFHAAVLRCRALSKVNLIEINLFLLMEKPLKKQDDQLDHPAFIRAK